MKKHYPLLFTLNLLLVVSLFLNSCSNTTKHKTNSDDSTFENNKITDTTSVPIDPKKPTPTSVSKGKQLSKIYCVRCHVYPKPSLLDKQTWVHQTLLNMGTRLGIFKHNGVKYPIEHTANLPKDLYPDTALISQANWQRILDFYHSAAPKKLKMPEPDKKIKTDPLFFTARTPDFREKAPPMVTSIRLDPGNKTIYLGNASNNKFMVFNSQLKYIDHLNITSPISYIDILNDDISKPGTRDLLLSYIGDLQPSDALKASVMRSLYNPQTKEAHAGYYVANHIERTVESQMADWDGDGKADYLINEFGHRRGHLFWLKNGGNGKPSKKHVLTDVPGCIRSVVTDLNNDSKPDVVALCAQSDEAIYLFKNEGNGHFSNKDTLIQFPVDAGSSSFEMDDFNNDGHLDILYTSGDNADYSTIYKPYHGVYIYLNDGKGNFKKKWFYHINGAYSAKARDFDKDGNLDIAAISFFADYKHRPQEGFVYFENEGELSFTPYHQPATSAGRWISMDVADFTGNGYDDIVLGNFSLGPTKVASDLQKKWSHGPHFLLLENHAEKMK